MFSFLTAKEETITGDITVSERMINIGDWILVPFLGKRYTKYFAGQVTAKEDFSTATVKFLRFDKRVKQVLMANS